MTTRLAFSYLAFSTLHQKEGRSVARQESAAEVWAKAHGFKLAPGRQYRDEGVSRYNGKARMKGALSRFLALCGTPAVPAGSILIIEDFDRLSRENPDDAWELFRQILIAEVEIFVLSLDRWFKKESLRRFEDRLLVQACQHRAHTESHMKAVRQKDKWADRRRRAQRGEGGHTKLPSWLRLDADRKPVLIRERAEDIRFMARRIADGCGALAVAVELTKGPNARPCWLPGGQWDAQAVRRVLLSPAVWGAYQPHRLDDKRRSVPAGKLIRGHYPAVLPEDEANAVRRVMALRKHDRGRPAERNRSVLRRLIRDAETGGYLTLRRTGKLADHDYLSRRWEGRNQLVAPYAVLETLVLRAVQEWTPGALTPRNGPADRRRQADHLGELGAIAADREAIKEELSRRGRAASTAAILAEQLDALDAREAQVKEELADLESAVGGVPSATLGECQSLVVRLAALPESEKPGARRDLNARLRDVLQGVWIYRRRLTPRTAELIVQVWPRAGEVKERRVFLGRPPSSFRPLDTGGADFRQGYPSPKTKRACSPGR